MTFIFVYKVILRIKKKRKPDKNGSMIQTGDLCKEHQYSMDIYKTLLSTETKQRYRKRQYRNLKKSTESPIRLPEYGAQIPPLPLSHFLDKKHYLSKPNIFFSSSLIEEKFE